MRIRSEREVHIYKAKDERIFNYILKKCVGSCDSEFGEPLEKLLKMITSSSTAKGGEPYLLSLLRKKIMDCQTILLLGEPDYIQLYLSYYPIVTSPFLLNGADDQETTESSEPMTALSVSDTKPSD